MSITRRLFGTAILVILLFLPAVVKVQKWLFSLFGSFGTALYWVIYVCLIAVLVLNCYKIFIYYKDELRNKRKQ